ncbi:TauD/TfdA family dioxygenase [Kitasatospora sp. NPDC058170]|uniref:TauD/TfdA family dioxygenase n=1 Tax=Kitasatospora sp. NPDC058170 TaxID=3346364 RepID=UPI0036DADF02
MLSTISQTATSGPHTLTLSDVERDEFRGLAEQLATTAPALIDHPAWVDAARELSCRIPLSLREAVRAYRHDPGEGGTLLLRNLPVDEATLPPTPAVAESVERAAAVPAAVAVLVTLNLGELASYREEKAGALVQNVVPVPGRETSQSNAGSHPLELHVENAFHPHRPDYVGLLCLRHDRAGTAGTLVSSIRKALGLLPADVREVLHGRRFTTAPPPSFHGGDAVPLHAVLSGDPEDPNVQVDFHVTHAVDDEGKIALEHLRDAFIAASQSVVLSSGDMAFVDNRVAIHGRSAFQPTYDGRDRWLHRTFAHLDRRRTRGHRPGDTNVLS